MSNLSLGAGHRPLDDRPGGAASAGAAGRRALLALGCLLAAALTLVAATGSAGTLSWAGREAGGKAPGMTTAGMTKEQGRAAYDKLPLNFVPNAGQLDRRVRYSAQAGTGGFFFTKREAVFSFATKNKGLALRLGFRGANPQVRVSGEKRGSGKVNYLIGRDPAHWRTNLPTYSQVVYRDLWPGIDLAFHGSQGRLKYELHVAPGASVRQIGLAYAGASGLSLDRGGNLEIKTALGSLKDSRPVSYQEVGGKRVPVESRFVLGPTRGAYRFAVGAYDHSRPLVVYQGGLIYSTFLGGGNTDEVGYGIALSANSAYVTGYASAANFPTTVGPGYGGGRDVFVTRLNPAGSNLLYSTYLGGTQDDIGYGIAVDGTGNAYVTGSTASSTTFPRCGTALCYTGIYGGGVRDAFVTQLNPAGNTLLYSTFLGGSLDDRGNGIGVDSAGKVYVTGRTKSATFPTTTNAFQLGNDGNYDAFVTKLNPLVSTGSLLYSTYLGGGGYDGGYGLAVDSAATPMVYITGGTQSTDFDTKIAYHSNPYNPAGIFDAFVAKLNPLAPLPAANTLVYSTYLGGIKDDSGAAIAVDPVGSTGMAYVTGYTRSADFPTAAAWDPNYNGLYDVFVAKLDTAQGVNGLLYSTYLGGIADDLYGGIAVDSSGNAYVTGRTSSGSSVQADRFPTTLGAYDEIYNGGIDAFVTELNPQGSALVYSTFLGGSADDWGSAIAIDGARNAYVTGQTRSANFPTPLGGTSGAYDKTYNGGIDAFVTNLNAGGNALNYSTYLGGSSDDAGYGIAVMPGIGARDAFVTGYTESVNFPATSTCPCPPGFGATNSGGTDAFVTRLNAAGSALVYSTYLGGGADDFGYAIAVDATGQQAYVTGETESNDFPTSSGAACNDPSFDTIYNGANDAFVTKLDSTGAICIYSTFLGGNNDDRGNGIGFDNTSPMPKIYVTGRTKSTQATFPVTPANAYDVTHNGTYDAFVTKLDPSLGNSGNLYTTYLGGSESDLPYALAVDSATPPKVYITGGTFGDFPTRCSLVAGCVPYTGSTDRSGNTEAFMAELDPSAPAGGNATLPYSTYLGGNDTTDVETGRGIAVDNATPPNVYVTGFTSTATFPTSCLVAPACSPYDAAYNGGRDVFMAELHPAADPPQRHADLVYSTFLGGSGDDEGEGIDVDVYGNAYVTGRTSSAGTLPFPTTGSAYATSSSGGFDAFVTELNPAGFQLKDLVYSTYLGGSADDWGNAIAVGGGDPECAYVTGQTSSGDPVPFPTYPATAFDKFYNGGIDAFVTRICPPPDPEQEVDHMKCYDVVKSLGFTETGVSLFDQFYGRDYRVIRPAFLCNPTRKIHGGRDVPIRRLQMHLVCYWVLPRDDANRWVRLTNQFTSAGGAVASVRYTDLLCVPSFKSLTGPPPGLPPPPNPPPPLDLDHFKCYVGNAPAAQPPGVTLFDQFYPSGQTDLVGSYRYLCNPVRKIDANGTYPPVHPDSHLACYHINRVFQNRTAFVLNQFGQQTLLTGYSRYLCAPSLKEIAPAPPPPPPPCDDDTDTAATCTLESAGTRSSDNTGATGQTGENGGSGVLNTQIYKWTAPTEDTYVFHTCDPASTLDTYLTAFTGEGWPRTIVASNDDDPLGCPSHTLSSRITIEATAGTLYTIQLDGYTGDVGPWVMTWGVAPPPPGILCNQYNNPGSNGVRSQDLETGANAFDSEAADDCLLTGPATARGVDVQGAYFNGPGPAAWVNVRFYDNNTVGPPANIPGNLLYARLGNTSYGGTANFAVDFGAGNEVALPAGTIWVSVQSRQDTPTGQWAWADRTVLTGYGAVWQNPGNGWASGCTTWNRRTACGYTTAPDLVYCLRNSAGNPCAPPLQATGDVSARD